MAHITAALDGVSEARLQALLGLPRMPWSRRGLEGPARARNICARTLDAVVARAAARRRAGRFPRPADPRRSTNGSSRGEARGARRRQCRDLLSRRPRDHRQRADLDPLSAVRAAGAAGAGGRRGAAGLRGRARRIRTCPTACRCSADARGIAAALSAGAALRPRGGRPPTGSARTRCSPATSSRSGRGCSTATASLVGRSRRLRSRTASRPRPRRGATASNIFRSAAARACASAPASPRSRR